MDPPIYVSHYLFPPNALFWSKDAVVTLPVSLMRLKCLSSSLQSIAIFSPHMQYTRHGNGPLPDYLVQKKMVPENKYIKIDFK